MSKTVDERVVEMRFDNQQFESNVKTSMSTIEKLKQSLHFKDTKNGLNDLNSSVKNVNLNPLAQGVDTVKAKFSALEVMGITALANITNSAVNVGKRIVSALTIDPVKTGFQEYETQINAVQTILANTANKGTTLEQVNAALDELNYYADKTIYNFTEMTRNIGTFTAAGIDLETSVSAIQGIANLAAVSGSTSQQASTAMYQLSQALASGTVKLMDWNSVVNAGMGGQVFQTALRETSELLETGAEAAIEANGSFRESLSTGWLTAEVLTETLKKFTTSGANEYVAEYCGITEDAVQAALDAAEAQYSEAEAIDKASEALANKTGKNKEEIKSALEFAKNAEDAATKVKTFTQLIDTLKEAAQSGWTQTWELIVGDFEEAKALWTEASDFFGGIIENMSNARNEVVEEAFGSKWNEFAEYLEKAGISVETFQSKLNETLKASGISLSDLIKKYGSLAGAISSGKISKSAIIETLKKFVTAEKEVSKVTSEVTGDLEKFQKVVNQVIKGDFDNGTKRIEKLTQAGYDYATVQKLVNKVYEKNGKTWKDTTISAEDLAEAIGDLSAEELQSIGYTEEQAKQLKNLAAEAEKTGTPLNELIASLEKPSGRTLVIDTIRNAITGLVRVLSSMKNAWRQFFDPISGSQVYNVITKINALSQKLLISEESVNKLQRSFAGLFAILDLVRIAVSGVVGTAFKLLGKILSKLDLNILDVTASIGDALVAFHDWVLENSVFAKIVDKLITLISLIVVKVKDWIKEFLELPQVTKVIEKFHEIATEALEFVCAGIDELIEKVGKLDKITLNDITSAFKKFGSNVRDSLFDSEGDFIGLDTVLDEFPKRLRNFVNKGIAAPLAGSGKSINNFKDNIVSSFGEIANIIEENIGLGEILTVAFGGSVALALAKTSKVVTQVLDTISGPFKEVNGFVRAAKLNLTNFAKILRGFEFSVKATALLKIAGAIAILAGSIFLLSQIPTKTLWSAVGAIAALAVVLGVLAFAISNMNIGGSFSISKKGITGSFSTILGIAIAIGILVAALKVLETLKTEYIIQSMLVIAGLLTGIVVACAMLAKHAKALPACAVTIIAIAGALRLMVEAVKALDGIDFDHFGKDLILLTAIILGLGSVTAAASKLTDWKAAIGVVVIASSVRIMAEAIKNITTIDMQAAKKNIGAFVIVFGSIIGLMLLGRLAAEHAHKGGLGILGMSVAIGVLVLSIRALSKMDQGDIDRAVETIGALFTIFGLVVALSKFAGEFAVKAGGMILLMSASLIVLTGAIVVLSHIDPLGMDRAVSAISKIMIVFGMVVALSHFAGEVTIGPIVGITIALSVLIAAIGFLAMIPEEEKIDKAVNALTKVMIVFGIVEVLSQFAIGDWKSLTAMAGAITIIGGVLIALTTIDPDGALKAASGLSLVIAALSASVVALKFMPVLDKKAIITLGIMVGVVAAIAAILGIMAGLNVEPSIKTAASISVLLLALAGAFRIMTAGGSLSPVSILYAAKSALALSVFISILAGVFGAITGLLSLLPEGAVKKIQEGAKVLSAIGYAIGEFAGAIVGGALGGITSGLPSVGSNISSFAKNIQPFINFVKGIDSSIVTNVGTLSKAILAITTAEFLNALTSGIFGDNSLEDFSNDIKGLGGALKAYAESVSGIEQYETSMTAAVTAANALADLNNSIPKIGGLAGALGGDEQLGEFAINITRLGNGLIAYAESVSGIEQYETSMTAAVTAGKALADLNGALPKSGGLWQVLFGENELSGFAINIERLGKGLISYAESVSGIEQYETSMASAVTAGKALADLNNAIPKSEGLWQTLFGENGLGSFGNNIETLGDGLMKYAESVSGIEQYETSITSSITAAKAFSNLAKNLPEEDAFDGKASLTDIGKDFKGLCDKLKDAKLDNVSTLANSVKTLLSSIKSFSSTDYSGIGKFKTAVTELSKLNLASISTALNSSMGKITASVSTLINKMASTITSKSNIITAAFKRMFSNALSSIKGNVTSFKAAGLLMVTNMVSGVQNGKSKLATAFKEICTNAKNRIQSWKSSFEKAGKSLGEGLVDGINAKKSAAYDAGYALGQSANKGLRAALVINSPSKVAMSSGNSIGEGLVIGMQDMGRKVYNAGYDLGSYAVESLSNSITKINALLSDDIDVEPTIRPVLDLSDIRSGVGAMNGMLNFGPSVGVMANTGAISSMMNEIQNGASNDDVVSAIGDLGRKISNMSNPTYNINGITYDDGSNISNAVKSLIRAARVERRV